MMNQNQNDEIDLLYAIEKIKQGFKNLITLIFKGIEFVIKLWYVVLLLIVLGVGLAWFRTQDTGPDHHATMIVKINYDFQSYAMNAFENFNQQIDERDKVFLKKFNFDARFPNIYGVKFDPIVDFKDILDDYETNDRGLETLLRNVDFEGEEIEVKDYFIPKYDLYELEFSTTKNATAEDIDNFFEYVNNNEKLAAYKNQVEEDIEYNIQENLKSITLINELLESYTKPDDKVSTTIDFNPNANGLVTAKEELQLQNSKLKKERVLATEIVYPLSEVHIVKKPVKITSNKRIIYPLVLVFLFLALSYLRYLYLYFRKIARENKSQ